MKSWAWAAVVATVMSSSVLADLGESRLGRDSTDRAGSRYGRGAPAMEAPQYPRQHDRPAVDSRGRVYAPAGSGYVGQDGSYYAPAGPNVVVDPRTGQVIPIGR